METIHIEVVKDKYKSIKEARMDGQLPLIAYTGGKEPQHFTTHYQDFRRAFLKAGKSSIVTLRMDGKDLEDVIVQSVQYDPVSDNMIHVDLKIVDKNQKISTDIPLVFIGESPAVREQGGTLVVNKNQVHIECLPKDLPHEIEVDISPLIDFHSSLTVGDIKISDKITILDSGEISIATVSAPRKEEIETAAPVAPETEITGQKPVEEEGKAEEKK